MQALDTTDQCAPRCMWPRSLPTSVSPISNPTRPWQSAPGQIKPKEYSPHQNQIRAQESQNVGGNVDGNPLLMPSPSAPPRPHPTQPHLHPTKRRHGAGAQRGAHGLERPSWTIIRCMQTQHMNIAMGSVASPPPPALTAFMSVEALCCCVESPMTRRPILPSQGPRTCRHTVAVNGRVGRVHATYSRHVLV